MEHTMEWNIICRICLQEGDMRSIFENDEDDNNLRICDKIMCCSNVKIHKNENFPENICTKCYEQLNIAYIFRKNCEHSDTILQSFIINNKLIITNKNERYNDLMIKRLPSNNNILFSSLQKAEQHENHSNESIVESDIKIEQNKYCKVDKIENLDSNFIQTENDAETCSKSVDNDDIDEESIYLEYQDNSTNDENNLEEEYVLSTEIGQENVNDDNNDDISQGTIELIISEEAQTYENTDRKLLTPISNGEDTKVLKNENKRKRTNNKMKRTSNKKEKESKLHICELCGNFYKQKHTLDIHMRRHRNEKPFSCEICGRGFVLNVELKSHMRTHTGQKPYGCRYCDRCFSDFGSRIKHERVHTGERPYVCGTCGKAFAYSYGLSSHILIHTGEKPFECPKCSRRFTKKHHLKNHLNTHMKKESRLKLRENSSKIAINQHVNDLKKDNISNANNDDVQIAEEFNDDFVITENKIEYSSIYYIAEDEGDKC